MEGIQVYKIKVEKGQFKNYCYLLVEGTSGEAALVDPAWEEEKIVLLIDSLPVTLKYILITHAHFDHINLAPSLAQRYQVPVYLDDLEMEAFGRISLVPAKSIREFAPVWIGDANIFTIPLGKGCVYALNTPGHTKGSISFLTGQALISGDTLFIEGCGVCDQAGGDPVEMFYSLSLITRLVNNDTCIFPGHCFGVEPGATFREVLQKNIYLHFQDVDKFVRFRMRKKNQDYFDFK